MVVGEAMINNIMGGIENTGSVRLHNHKRKLKQRFDIIKKLGQGTYGKVQLGINKETGQEVAIKTIKKSKIETEADLIRIRREIQIMSSVQHPNIIHIYEVFENREKIVIVMEYAAGGELYDYLFVRKMLPEEEARRIFRQIATACYYCHKHKICHRDLKLENILLDEKGNAKIADFGLSNVFDDHRHLSTYCGSPLYASPEIVKGTPYHGPEVDCWSLGVLLYTLVYGAMPFDGSNFKRLVKSISQGEYFEPQNPSRASGLIQGMLTVNPKNRDNIEKICAHWWVNESYDESCLDISEELANQTPVRLDVLLSLNPPPAQLEADKLVVTGDAEEPKVELAPPPMRSQSAGSLMEIASSPERRIKELVTDKVTPKRKLETTGSMEQANIIQDGKRKDKIVKESTVADISNKNGVLASETISTPSDNAHESQVVKMVDDVEDPSLQGAACAAIMEDAKRNEVIKKAKVKKTTSVSLNAKVLEEINEVPSQENIAQNDKENKEAAKTAANSVEVNKENKEKEVSPESKTSTTSGAQKKKVIKKKVLTDKNEQTKPKLEGDKKATESIVAPVKQQKIEESPVKDTEIPKVDSQNTPTSLGKSPERRQSRIFEQAEKFQSMISSGSDNKAPSPEKAKPKKIIIPGVSVGGFKKEFERRASLTSSTSPPKIRTTTSKKLIIDDKKDSIDIDIEKSPENESVVPVSTVNTTPPTAMPSSASSMASSEIKPAIISNATPPSATPASVPKPAIKPFEDVELKMKMKNAVSIISNALDKEGARKSKSRPCMVRKPPVPFGVSGRSASGSIGMISPLTPTAPKPFTRAISACDSLPLSSTPAIAKTPELPLQPENQTSSAEIVLKSATLPRRKSTKAEIQLDYPKTKPATMEFKTEMSHHVQAPPKLTSQRSEVTVPISSPPPVNIGTRSMSVEPESNRKEHIIPIAFEKRKEEPILSPPAKPPVPRMFQSQRSGSSHRSNSLSRQSTQESDTEVSASGEPIKKSPREYIIPIAVEGGGYVTPRAGSLEPSEVSSTTSNSSRMTSKFRTPRRMMSLFDRDASEDESPFTALHRHHSFGRDSDNEGEPKKNVFHRLRSSRPRKSNMEHADSLSSGEDDDDDDGFEFQTAENLFSTLLARVRGLTQRLNDDPLRPGFPNSRFLSHFDHGPNLFNRMEPLTSSRNSPLGRQFSRERSVNSSIPWRRSVSRDLSSDIDSTFSDSRPTQTSTLPRGVIGRSSSTFEDRSDDLNLSDLNLKKLRLTEEDALALSFLTPGLSRRIQKQLFASLPPSEAKKISRTMSMRTEDSKSPLHNSKLDPRSTDRVSSTLPRKLSYDKRCSSQQNLTNSGIAKTSSSTTNASIAKNSSHYLRDIASPIKDSRELLTSERPQYYRSSSLREPIDYKLKLNSYALNGPDTTSSISEIPSLKDSNISSALIKYANSKLTDQPKSEQKTRRISRFLRPDFFDAPKEDNVVLKEKKERERETQQVLKEIRDKRIKNRISSRRERSLSKEKEIAVVHKDKPFDESNDSGKIVRCKDLVESLKKVEKSDRANNNEDCANVATDNRNKTKTDDDSSANNIKDTEVLLKNVSDNIKNIETNVLSRQNEGPSKERSLKFVRPKSYPTEKSGKAASPLKESAASLTAENSNVNGNTDVTKKVSKLKKPSVAKSKFAKNDTTTTPDKVKPADKTEKQTTKSKFLQSIEKKFEKLRSMSMEDKTKEKESKEKVTEESTSGVGSTIKKLREQSEPRTTDQITESTLIKRAVSVEDFAHMKTKAIQPSRKSVSKILNLFKKYEEKDKAKDVPKKSAETALPVPSLNDISESNIPMFKTKTVDTPKDVKQADKTERPKSLFLDKVKTYNGSKSDSTASALSNDKTVSTSKLPVNSFRRNPNTEQRNGDSSANNNESNRLALKLDLKNHNTPASSESSGIENSSYQDYNLNRISYTTDESSTFLSPCDETLSCDSWSVCSDYHHTQDLLSPISPNGNASLGDESESVIDRIRRKSFYSRFNEKKKPRKSLIGSYRDLDLYKDYNQRSYKYKSPSPVDYGNSYRKSSLLDNDYREPDDYRQYGRSKSVSGDYVNVPNRYQTYNPKRTNIASLYERDDTSPPGAYKKYYNTQSKSQLSRSSHSPSSELLYMPRSRQFENEHSMSPDYNLPDYRSDTHSPNSVNTRNNTTEHVV